MVSNLMKNDKQIGTKSRQSNQKTIDNKARKLNQHLDGLTAANIYSNANYKKVSITNVNSGFSSIIANNAPPSPPKNEDKASFAAE